MVTVVLPEFVVEKRRHQILHGQTALVVKRHLLFEKGVVAASVPYHVREASSDRGNKPNLEEGAPSGAPFVQPTNA